MLIKVKQKKKRRRGKEEGKKEKLCMRSLTSEYAREKEEKAEKTGGEAQEENPEKVRIKQKKKSKKQV